MSKKGRSGIRQRSDGRWEGRYMAMVDGKWKRRSIFGRTSHDVDVKLTAAKAARNAGTAQISGGKATVGSFLEDWIAGIEPTLKRRTAAGYRQLIRDHLRPALGTTPLQKLRPEQVQKLYAGMLASGSSPKTIANVAGVLHAALQQAMGWHLVSGNVASLVKLHRRPQPEMHVLNGDQVRQLLEAADHAADPLASMWALALGSGMREGEILGLRWSDVDLDNRRLSVRHSLEVNTDVLVEPKTASSRRVVKLSPQLVDRLVEYRRMQGGIGNAFVFRRDDGRPLSAAMVLKRWHTALRRAGLEKMRFHDTRHSVATTLMDRTGNPKLVAKVLGHADVATTLRMYTHPTDEQHDQAAAILGEAL